MSDESTMTRTEALLALLVLHNMAEASQLDKTVLFNRVGFSNAEIAKLLGTSTATVSQNLYTAKKAKTTKPAAKKAATKVSKKLGG
jgi:DNA-directed RNA polymerase specialized sigma24 family protein